MTGKTGFSGRILYVGYVIVVTFLVLETALRFYYPFQRKIRGDKWKLSTNIVYRLTNKHNPRLDSIIINRRNSIGFRGNDPAADMSNRLTLLTVGGSTTACNTLTEGKTWTDILESRLNSNFQPVWINNAGLDGHSTHGHIKFLQNYLPELPFKPKIILFLIGANDIDRNDLGTIDAVLSTGQQVRRWAERHLETVNLLIDLKWIIRPVGIFSDKAAWNFTNFRPVQLSNAAIDSALQVQYQLLPAYEQRLLALIALCKANNIMPVFITQPLLFGDGTPEGGNPAIDFYECKPGESGVLVSKKLNLYNAATRRVANQKNVFCVNLASAMPKDTACYYDVVHYTNAGSQKLGNLIFDSLNQYLSIKFPHYIKH
jgi:hypothetical protein